MYTYSQLLEEGYDEIGDSSARAKRMLTKGINEGLTMFRSILKQYWTQETRTFTIQAGQTRYQLPERAVRGAELVVTSAGTKYRITQIHDDEEWDQVTATDSTATVPQIFRFVGADEFEIHPAPSDTIASGGKIKYQAKGRPLSVEDFSDGTVSVTNGSNEVDHSAAGFTPQMVGRSLLVTGDSSETNAYKIMEFVTTTRVRLENAYAGATDGTANFVVGEVPNIPGEFHLSLLDRGIFRYFRSKKDINAAASYKSTYDEALGVARTTYSGADMSAIVPSKKYRPSTKGLNTLAGKAGAVND